MGDVKPLSPEAAIVSQWRRNGKVASIDLLTHIGDANWCRTRLSTHATTPIEQGDLALLMEHCPDVQVREWCRKLVLETGFVTR